jgi:hypothetical protein
VRTPVKTLPPTGDERATRQQKHAERGARARAEKHEERRSPRATRPPWDPLKLPQHLVRPSYTACEKPAAGGRLSVATIGPSFTEKGTDANSRLPRDIDAARALDPYAGFVAGHLLNADFGGHGQKSANLTILSTAGNSHCKKFDDKIKKEAIPALRATYKTFWDAYLPTTDCAVGIRITVVVHTDKTWLNTYPSWYPEPVFDSVFTTLTFNAEAVGTLPADPPPGFDAAWELVKNAVAAANQYRTVENTPPPGGRKPPGGHADSQGTST